MQHDDRSAIVEATTRVAVLADRRDWDALRRVLAPKVTTDYSSLWGGGPVTVAAADLLAGWAEAFARFSVTQHLVTNHLVTVDGDTAVATADFQATHLAVPPDRRRWVLGGGYRYELVRSPDGPDGWLVSALTMTARWEDGDRTLLGLPPADDAGPPS